MWQHSKCLGIGQHAAERDDFHFVCRDCKRREEEAKLPKLPPLKFKVGGSSSPPSATAAANVPNGPQAPLSPVKRDAGATLHSQNASASGQQALHSSYLPPNTAQPFLYPPPSPERRPQTATQGISAPSSPSRAPFSPSKSVNGLTHPSREQPAKPMPGQYSLPPIHPATQPPSHGFGSFDTGSFPSQRPSSSQSAQSPTLPSPIKNRPSMSPTQGNRDVGFLAGFPANGTAPSPFTPSGQHHSRPNTASNDVPSSFHGRYPSFSAATPSAGRSSPAHSSHGVHLSGISPTKNSPRPLTSGSLTGAPVLPPIQALEPSPKLMGRSSPDAPIPSPTKCMTPEQEERKQRENTAA